MNVCSIAQGLEAGPRRIRDLVMAAAPDEALAAMRGEARLTFGQLRDEIDRYALGLLAMGVTRGDKVAVLPPSSLEGWTCVLAAWSIGAVAAPLGADEARLDPAAVMQAAAAVPMARLISARGAVEAGDPAMIEPGLTMSQSAVTASAIARAAGEGPETLGRWRRTSFTGDWTDWMAALAAGGAVVFQP
jgi:acyl-coenzyme A synthetase/AMP-(fatty) acid ligase